jgi:hypothetical protein
LKSVWRIRDHSLKKARIHKEEKTASESRRSLNPCFLVSLTAAVMASSSSPDDSDLMEGVDTEAELLLQFQCMGTNDRDALIMEFQRLLGPNTLQPDACAFFLEMNNW